MRLQVRGRPAGRDREVGGVVGCLAIFTARHLLLVAVPSHGHAVRFRDCIGSRAPPKRGGDDGSRTAGPSERARRISPSAPERRRTVGCKMTRTELIIQLLKVVIGLAFGAYFVWWSLEVLDRLTPDNEVPA